MVEKNLNAPPAKEGVKETAIIPQDVFGGNLTTAAPDWLKKKMEGHVARGLEAADSSDFIYPRLVLCQALTPFVRDGLRKEGDICDNLTGELFCEVAPKGKEPNKLLFVPVILQKARLFMIPFDQGGGISCRSLDSISAEPGGIGKDQGDQPTRVCGDCIHKEWSDAGGLNTAPACTEFQNVLGYLPQHGNRVTVFSAKSTQIKVMRRFLSLTHNTGADLWAHLFELFSVEEKNAQHTWRNWAFTTPPPPGQWVSEAQYNFGERLFKSVTGVKWAPNVKDLETPGTGTPSPAAGAEDAPF